MAKAELFQKDIPAEERVFYYASEEDDPIKTDEQEKKVEVGLPEGYEFIRNCIRRCCSGFLNFLGSIMNGAIGRRNFMGGKN